MADLVAAIDYVLRQEDSNLSGVVTHEPGDRGGRTRYGVAEEAHPDLTSTGFFDTMSPLQALDVARTVYRTGYATPLQIQFYSVQQIANAMLSFAVNEGKDTAIKLLQEALKIESDGIIGPKTIHLLNAVPPAQLLDSLRILQQEHYLRIIRDNPSQRKFFQGWINRVNKNCTL